MGSYEKSSIPTYIERMTDIEDNENSENVSNTALEIARILSDSQDKND
ncbi:10920_t:CDS:2 [Funneliformis mosseae]|uniref:10920_t:CDS:1 n=1 Tax=Funneliformis mosseae TaxID=27381 RepID=A0A9N8VPU7_FUNMO|nr:10920_t:CDS:2 [Funneliformis mosseae]